MDRNEQLSHARLYAEGIVNTIRDPLLILDKQLRVMSATQGFYNKFQVAEKDTAGNFIYDLGNRQWNIPALRTLLEAILPEKKEMTGFEVRHDFPGLGAKTMLLNARKLNRDPHTELILLSIEDITDVIKLQHTQPELEHLRLILAAEGLGRWVYDPATRTINYDSLCGKLLGLSGLRTPLKDVPE